MLIVSLKGGCHVTESMKDVAVEKLAFLPDITKGEAHLSVEVVNEHKCKLKLLFTLQDGHNMQLKTEGHDYYSALDKLRDIARGSVKKYNNKKRTRVARNIKGSKRSIEDYVVSEQEDVERIMKRKSFAADVKTEAQAIEHMEILGHDFYVFHNKNDEGNLSILYRRNDDTLGVIRCS